MFIVTHVAKESYQPLKYTTCIINIFPRKFHIIYYSIVMISYIFRLHFSHGYTIQCHDFTLFANKILLIKTDDKAMKIALHPHSLDIIHGTSYRHSSDI